jgi:hypothetical protein
MLHTWIPPHTEKLGQSNGFGGSPQIMIRIFKVIYILFSLEVGIFFLWLPWLSFWDSNYLTIRYPLILPLVTNSYFKGAILGLGIVNILIGIHEIVHFKKHSRGIFYR